VVAGIKLFFICTYPEFCIVIIYLKIFRKKENQAQQSHLLDLLDVDVAGASASGAEAAWVDPWGTPAHPSEPPAPVMPPRPKVFHTFLLLIFVVYISSSCFYVSLYWPFFIYLFFLFVIQNPLKRPFPEQILFSIPNLFFYLFFLLQFIGDSNVRTFNRVS